MVKRRDIQVNELERYKKTSNQLVLEEYSSCEVPAGCGGAIMRWIDPHEALPMHIWLYSTGKTELFFDGAASSSSRIDVRPGKHVLAMCVRPEGTKQPQLALAVRYSDTDKAHSEPKRAPTIGRKIEFLSGSTAQLLGTANEPIGDAWKQVDYDNPLWSALTREAAKTNSAEKDWHLDQVETLGARRVALPKAKGPIWIRCTFVIDLEVHREYTSAARARPPVFRVHCI